MIYLYSILKWIKMNEIDQNQNLPEAFFHGIVIKIHKLGPLHNFQKLIVNERSLGSNIRKQGKIDLVDMINITMANVILQAIKDFLLN